MAKFSQPTIRVYANDAPAVVDKPSNAERPQNVLNRGAVEEGTNGNTPGESRWKSKIATYMADYSKHGFQFNRFPERPDRASQRYRQRRTSQRPNSLSIQLGQKELLDALPLLGEWTQDIHPEGNVLFYNKEMRIATESDIGDTTIRGKLLFAATTLIQRAIGHQACISLDEFTELVLNVDNENWYYYFVDHSNHLLFWVDPIDVNELGIPLQGVTKHNHIKYFVKSLYWMHCEYYPHDRTLPGGILKNLRGMLNHAKTDMMTGHSPSSPFAKDELVEISDLVHSESFNLKDNEDISNPYSVWVIARLMSYFTDNQFVNFCGQPSVHLNADTFLFEQPNWNRRPLFRVVDLLLFGSPNEHARRLHQVWVDNMIIQPRWKDFVDRLTTEWGRYTIFSTVMLAVDFSFLAVPGVVDQTHGANTTQIIIYCSIVATIASIVFSFTLLNAYNNPGLMRAVPAGKAMYELSQIRSGMMCLSVTHSLPMASLIWSITLFSTALAIQIFGPKQLATIVTLGVECLIIVLLVLVCFFVTGVLYGVGDVVQVGGDGERSLMARTRPSRGAGSTV
ncbi:hypothetical protein JVU11DRAFT_3688 [Chiua virens]|nr:hypothetical protein JVU11DRAFT_3688 [Chiua virens]